MANLYFPQLSSGALAQYPIQKVRVVPTVKNVMLDGNMLLYTGLNSNPAASRMIWELSYYRAEPSGCTSTAVAFCGLHGAASSIYVYRSYG